MILLYIFINILELVIPSCEILVLSLELKSVGEVLCNPLPLLQILLIPFDFA